MLHLMAPGKVVKISVIKASDDERSFKSLVEPDGMILHNYYMA